MDNDDESKSDSCEGSNAARCESYQRYAENDQLSSGLDNILRAVKDSSFVRKNDGGSFNRLFESLCDFLEMPPEVVEERWRKIRGKPFEIVKKTIGRSAQTRNHPYRRKTFTNVSNSHHPPQSRTCNLLEIPVGLSMSTPFEERKTSSNTSQQSSSQNSEEGDPFDVEIIQITDEETEASNFSQGSSEKSEQQKHEFLDEKFDQPKATTVVASAEDRRGACFARYLIELMRGMPEFERAAKEMAMLRIVFDMD